MSKSTPTSMMMSGSMTSRYLFPDEEVINQVCRGLRRAYMQYTFTTPNTFSRRRICVRKKSGGEITEKEYDVIYSTMKKLETENGN